MHNSNAIIIFLACIFSIIILGKILVLPIRKIIKLIINSILGGVLIIIINSILGNLLSIHIGLNMVTAIFTGLLGIPGAILLIILKIVLV